MEPMMSASPALLISRFTTLAARRMELSSEVSSPVAVG